MVVPAVALLRGLLGPSYIRAVWLELAAIWNLLALAQVTRDVLGVVALACLGNATTLLGSPSLIWFLISAAMSVPGVAHLPASKIWLPPLVRMLFVRGRARPERRPGGERASRGRYQTLASAFTMQCPACDTVTRSESASKAHSIDVATS